ncbi:5-formyltetrahydrofolate cyclo-ligase [Lachnospiraceae bacterium TWA4]|nr:5-formyltetrahydrofolate cyclo-ligase [Lachnospiraceae bacterium TWA4]
MQEKKEIRKTVQSRRDAATDEQVVQMSEKVADFIESIPQYKEADCVYAYIDFNHEVKTDVIVKRAWASGKRVAVPKVVGKDLIWYYIEKDEDLEPGYMGIPEPKTTLKEAHETDAFFIMPGVAFDRGHHRVGYGGGYYDRYLEKPNTHYKAAIAFEFQIFDAVPFEAHDILPDAIVSEKAIY